MNRKTLLWTALLVAAISIAAGCGGDGSPKKTPTARATPRATRAAATPSASAMGRTKTPSASAGTGTSATTTPTAAGKKGTSLKISAKDVKFDKTALQARAGTVEITFENEDSGVKHNFHLYEGTSASGESYGMTPIKTGPNMETLKVELKAGTYFFQCDVHPQQMMGTLTVQ